MQDQFLFEAQQQYADLPLRFESVLVIVGGGEVDAGVLAELVASGASVIAADGGADICASHGVTPHAIIGDMDSVNDLAAWRGRARLIKLDEQHSTDFEKCLYSTQAPVTIALGMTGKRLDHTLAALDSAARYARRRQIVFVDSDDLAWVCAGPVSFAVKPGERVSVHPLQRVRFAKSHGLTYPLDGLTLAPGEATGTSNRAEDGPFSIEPGTGERGAWLLIVDRRHLMALIAAIEP